MRDYGKVYSTFWSGETTSHMTDDGKLLALYLMTCSHSTIAGVFRLPDGYASEDLGWTPERVQKGFVELLGKGFANRCETTKWVWVVKHLEWNKPENPNQIKSAAKIAIGIPDACHWKRAFMRDCGGVLALPPMPDPDPCETLSEGFLNQELEQKQDLNQEQEKPTASSAADRLPTCPYQSIVDLYHEVLPELPRVKVMDDDRKKPIRKRWEWVLTTSKPDGERRAETAAEALEWFRSYFDRTRDNDFLMARTPRNAEHKNWKCDLDFLMTSRGLKQVLEKTQAEATA